MRKNLLALVLAGLPVVALANGYNVPNVNPQDLGMCDSRVAAQGTAAAAYRNPAALSALPGLNLSLGLSLLDLRTDWVGTPATDATGPRKASMSFHPVTPPALFASYGGKVGDHGWGVGGGWSIVAGGNVFWPDTWAGRFRIDEVDRKVHAFYFTGGFEVVKQLRLGGGLVYYRTTERLVQGINFLGQEGKGELGASGDAFSWDLSAVITPVPEYPLWIGVDYKHQGVQTLTGRAHFSNVPVALAGNLPDQNVSHVLTIPNYLNVGAAWKPVRPLLLTFGYTFDRYKVYPVDVFAGDQGTTIIVPRNYTNGHTYRLGAEYTVSPKLQVRAGVLRDISGLDTNAYSPTLPDSNAWGGSVGASWFFTPELALHAAIFYANLDKVTATGPEAFPGTYHPYIFIYSLAVTWALPSLAP